MHPGSNAGQSQDAVGRYSGWLLSVIYSLIEFLNSSYDYYIYVEQDVLLRSPTGRDMRRLLVEHCGEGLMFGGTHGKAQPLQQSLFVIHRSRAERFLTRLVMITAGDRQFSPEWKFLIASSKLPRAFATLPPRLLQRIVRLLPRRFWGYRDLPFSGGRSRPIPDDGFAYIQHATHDELQGFLGPDDLASLRREARPVCDRNADNAI